jgi:6-phosphogluconolactonase (cycloisomerase 2 family)
VGSINGASTFLVDTPSPRYAYASSVDGSISEYAIVANGGIASQGYVIVPSSVYFPPVVESTGKYLYSITDPSVPAIAAFQTGLDGHLTAAFGSPYGVSNSAGLSSLVADPTANFLFGVTQDGIVPYSIDLVYAVPTAGSVVPITNLTALAVDPLGRFLYALQSMNSAGNIFAFTINSDGSLTAVKNSPFPAPQPSFGDSGFKVDPTGRFLYELAPNGVSEYAINSQTGALTSVGSLMAAGSNPVALTISPNGNELLVSDSLLPNDQVWAFNLDSLTGALSQVSGSPLTLGSTQTLLGTSFDPSGKYAFAAESWFIETLSVNASTGALTSISKTLAKENAAPLILGGANALSYIPQFAYTTNTGSASVSAFSVNASTGSLTQLNSNTPYAVGSSALSLAVVPGVEVVVTDAAAENIDYFPQNSDGTLGKEQSVPSQAIPIWPQAEPAGSVVDPSGRFVYVVDAFANGMEAYSTVPFAPLLPPVFNFVAMGSPLSGGAYPAGTTPAVTIIDPTGTFLLTVNQFKPTMDLFRINSLGELIDDASFLLPPFGSPTGIAMDPTTGSVVVSVAVPATAYVYTLDPINQTLDGPTVIPLPFAQVNSVAINPANHAVYFPFSSGNTAPGGVGGYILSTTNGVATLTPISGSPFTADYSPASMTISGSFAYVANFGSNDISLFNVNASSGALTFVGNTSLPLAVGPVQVTVTGSFK